MPAIRHPGVHEAEHERVLLVTKHKTTGAERVDWWPSVEEAEASDQIVLETRERITVEGRKKNWSGIARLLHMVLGRSGTQDYYLRERPLKQKEFFETVGDKDKDRKG